MHAKQILSLAAVASASAHDAASPDADAAAREILLGRAQERALQGLPTSATCLIAKGLEDAVAGFLDCCPCANPDDELCTFAWCMEIEPKLELKPTCGCESIVESCDKFGAIIAQALEGLTETCAEAKTCCTEGVSTEDFNACMWKGIDEGRVATPDLSMIGGAPDLQGDGNCTEEMIASMASDATPEAAATEETDATPEAAATEETDATPEAAATEEAAKAGAEEAPKETQSDKPAEAKEPEDDSGASGRAVALMTLVGASLAIAIV